MYALTFYGNKAIRFERVPDPAILDPGDVIVKVERTAICGSDLHVYHERERGIDRGCIMGHEFAGTVVARGAQVKTLAIGQRVASPFTTSCGRCFYCQRGLSARCEHGQLYGWVAAGSGLQGTQAELVRVPLADSTLVAVPDGVSSEEALLLGDVLSTGYYAAQLAAVHPEGVYAIVGCGPVGLMAILGARELGARRLYAIDNVTERLGLAERFGATPLNYRDVDPVEVLRGATSGRGADAVMEAVGQPSAGALAYDMVRPGGTIAIVGVHTTPSFAFTPEQAYNKNLTIRIGRCPARSLMPTLLPILRNKTYDVTAIITHRFSLVDGPRAYRIFDEKSDHCIKAVLTP